VGGTTVAGGELASVEVYGPVLAFNLVAGMPGATISVSATNFAPDAPLALIFNGTSIATAATDALGQAALTFTVPSLAPGAYTVIAVDDRSQYPVQQPFRIQ
jgi:hypothetical protein